MTISRGEEGEQAAEAFAAIFERDVDFNCLFVEESRPPFCNPGLVLLVVRLDFDI